MSKATYIQRWIGVPASQYFAKSMLPRPPPPNIARREGRGCGEGLPSDQVWAPSDDGGGGVVVVVEVVVASEGGLRWQLLSSSTGLVGSSSVHLLQTGHDEEGEVGNTGPLPGGVGGGGGEE